jgi:hypothetical protein
MLIVLGYLGLPTSHIAYPRKRLPQRLILAFECVALLAQSSAFTQLKIAALHQPRDLGL